MIDTHFTHKYNTPLLYRNSAKSQMALVEQMMVSAKLQMKSAESQVTSSKKELDDAKEYLKSVEKKMEVIDVDLSDSEDKDKGSVEKKKKRKRRGVENNENGSTSNAVVDLSRSTSTNATFGRTSALTSQFTRSASSGVQNERDNRRMQIFVKPENKTLTLDVKASDTVLSVKQKIHERGYAEPKLQSLRYGGKSLEDDKVLSDYNIQKESQLQYSFRWSMMPSIKISVENLVGKVVTLDVSPSNKVSVVKTKYYSKEGISPANQSLIFGGSVLDDAKTLSECNIQNQSKVIVVIRSSEIPIAVEMLDGKSIKLNISISDKVSDLKSKINAVESIPVAEQCLIFKGITLDNEKTLSEYNIQRESKVHLSESSRKTP